MRNRSIDGEREGEMLRETLDTREYVVGDLSSVSRRSFACGTVDIKSGGNSISESEGG